MPIVRTYPVGEVSPQPLPDVALNVPAAGDAALFGADRARDLQAAGQALGQVSDSMFAIYERHAKEANETRVQDRAAPSGGKAVRQWLAEQTFEEQAAYGRDIIEQFRKAHR